MSYGIHGFKIDISPSINEFSTYVEELKAFLINKISEELINWRNNRINNLLEHQVKYKYINYKDGIKLEFNDLFFNDVYDERNDESPHSFKNKIKKYDTCKKLSIYKVLNGMYKLEKPFDLSLYFYFSPKRDYILCGLFEGNGDFINIITDLLLERTEITPYWFHNGSDDLHGYLDSYEHKKEVELDWEHFTGKTYYITQQAFKYEIFNTDRNLGVFDLKRSFNNSDNRELEKINKHNQNIYDSVKIKPNSFKKFIIGNLVSKKIKDEKIKIDRPSEYMRLLSEVTNNKENMEFVDFENKKIQDFYLSYYKDCSINDLLHDTTIFKKNKTS